MSNPLNISIHIRLAAINVNSLIANHRRYELVQFTETHNHDVIFITETKLNKSHIVSFKNYNIVRRDRPNAIQGGGTAILIKREIPFEIVDLPSAANNEILEFTIIKIRMNNNKSLYLGSLYAKNDNRNLFINEINQLFQDLNLDNNRNYFILAGDLNARRKAWGDRADNQRGKYMRQWTTSFDAQYKLKIITPAFPTFKPAGTFLDVCLADTRLIWTDALNDRARTLPYDSDHAAISLTFESQDDSFILNGPSCQGIKYNYRATNWEALTRKISELYIQDIPHYTNLSIDEINFQLQHITDTISQSMADIIPTYKQSDSINKYLNHKIRKLQKDKKYIVSLLHKLHILDPTARLRITREAKRTQKRLSKALQREFKLSIEGYWNNTIKNIDFRKSDSFFPKINAIFRPKSFANIDNIHVQEDEINLLDRSGCNLDNIQKSGNEYVFTERLDKLNIIGAHYEYINSPRFINNDTRLKQIIDLEAEAVKLEFHNNREQNKTLVQFDALNPASNPTLTGESLQPFCNPASLAYKFKHLPNKTSAALDGIPPIVLKHLPAKVIFNLTIIFNNAINNCYFPSLWKEAKVLPVLKKGKNPNSPSSYRPISLTPSLSKVFEMVLNDALTEHCTTNKIIPVSQFGFKHHHSTTHAIHKMMSDVNNSVARSRLVGTALLDVEKAFDSVWLNGLLVRMCKNDFPRWLVHMVWDMVSGKSFVTWDGISVSPGRFWVVEGLQQGTVNSPILFNIFISELPRLFEFNTLGHPSLLSFADDLVVYVTGNRVSSIRDDLEAAVNKISNYLASWNLKINPSKCETILFRKPLSKLSTRSSVGQNKFQISILAPNNNTSTPIPHRKSVKYLGVHLDYLLRGNKHIDIQLDKAGKAFLSNGRVFHNKYLSSKAKTILYMLLVRPILTYAAPVWWNFNHTCAERLRCFERKCLRACLGLYRSQSSDWQHYVSNQTLYNKAEIPRIDNLLLKITREYFAKLPNIDNELLKAIAIKDDEAASREFASGYLTPQAFLSCDALGLIQNECNIPWIYHWRRNKADKRIALTLNDSIYDANKFKYSSKIPDKDLCDFHRLNYQKFWWLNGNCPFLSELSDRRQVHSRHTLG